MASGTSSPSGSSEAGQRGKGGGSACLRPDGLKKIRQATVLPSTKLSRWLPHIENPTSHNMKRLTMRASSRPPALHAAAHCRRLLYANPQGHRPLAGKPGGGGVQPPAAKMCLRNSWYCGSVASPNGGSCRSGAASLTATQSAGVSSLAARGNTSSSSTAMWLT